MGPNQPHIKRVSDIQNKYEEAKGVDGTLFNMTVVAIIVVDCVIDCEAVEKICTTKKA